LIPETSPLHSSESIQSNVYIRMMEEEIRVLRSALEERLGTPIDHTMFCFPWLTKHAGW